jgi:hypothetical protein
MRPLLRIPLVVVLFGALALPASADAPKVPSKPLPAGANAVNVIPWGLFFHRSDHLILFDQESVTPEEAQRRTYWPCPECTPPLSSRAAAEEAATGKRRVSSYYKLLLDERAHPTSTEPPRGAIYTPTARTAAARPAAAR